MYVKQDVNQNVLSHIYEFKDEMFANDNTKFCEMIHDDFWCSKLAHLSDIFEIPKDLNSNK